MIYTNIDAVCKHYTYFPFSNKFKILLEAKLLEMLQRSFNNIISPLYYHQPGKMKQFHKPNNTDNCNWTKQDERKAKKNNIWKEIFFRIQKCTIHIISKMFCEFSRKKTYFWCGTTILSVSESKCFRFLMRRRASNNRN